MPRPPKKSESHEKYMKYCVPVFKKEGKSSKKARKQCNAIWYSKQAKKGKKK